MSRCVTLECERYSCSRVSGRAVQSCQHSSITLAPLSTPYSRAAVQHWSGQRSDSCEQQQRCSIATSLVKQLTSPPAERLLLRVPVGRVPSCPRLSTVCPLSTSSTVVSSVLSLLFSYEHFWSSQYEHSLGRKPVYHEGMILSLILDHKDNPLIWQELAVRRWCTLQFAANKGGTAEAWGVRSRFPPNVGLGWHPCSLDGRTRKVRQAAVRVQSTSVYLSVRPWWSQEWQRWRRWRWTVAKG